MCFFKPKEQRISCFCVGVHMTFDTVDRSLQTAEIIEYRTRSVLCHIFLLSIANHIQAKLSAVQGKLRDIQANRSAI